MKPDPVNPHAPSVSGYAPQNPTAIPDGSQGSVAVAQTKNTTLYVQPGVSEQAAAPDKHIGKRQTGHVPAQSDAPRPYRTRELLEWANASNHPDTIAALKECRLTASADRAEPGQESLNRLKPQEQLQLLRLHLDEKPSKARKTDTQACHIFNPTQKTFGTPVEMKLSVNGQEQTLSLPEQSRLANDVVLDEVSDRLKGICKPGHESKWKGDLKRSDIALQVEGQDKISGARWILPIHSVNPNRRTVQKTSDKKSADDDTGIEEKVKVLTEKLQSVIPGAVPTIKDVVRQDTLNPVYLFITDKFGITPSSSTQTYSVKVTAINPDEFRVENKAQFTKYSKLAVKKNYDGKTTILVQSHFKRDHGQFVPAGLSVDINLDDIKLKHLPDEPKMKHAKSAEALNRGRARAAASFNLSPPAMRRQISQQHNVPVKLGITLVGDQLYAMNMNALELEHEVAEKTAIQSYKTRLADARNLWKKTPEASSMSVDCRLTQTSTQLSKLNSFAPTPDFFEMNRTDLPTIDASTRTVMEQAEAAYKRRWLKKAAELETVNSDAIYQSTINRLPPMTLKGEKIDQFVKLSGRLEQMSKKMIRLAEEAKAAKRCFTRQELTREQLLSKLLDIKLESSQLLKKLRGSGCEFSSLCEQYGFYKNQKNTEGHEAAVQYLEKKKARVMLEEKQVGLSVMQAIIEAGSSDLPESYGDLFKFINNPMAFDAEGKCAAMISTVLKDEYATKQCKLFSEGSFRKLDKARNEAYEKLHARMKPYTPLSLAHWRIIQQEINIELQPTNSKNTHEPAEDEILQLTEQKLWSNPYYYEVKLDNIINRFDKELT